MITEIGYLIAFDLPRATNALAKLIERHHGNVVEAAKEAGVSRRTFDRWLTRAGLLGTFGREQVTEDGRKHIAKLRKRVARIHAKMKKDKEVKP